MTNAYVLTATGGHFHFYGGPTVRIDDIARHLAKSCRFLGATSAFYSIAQHSVLVSDIVATSKRDDNTPETRLYALLDSAHKAFIGEVSPLARQAMVDCVSDCFDRSHACNPYDSGSSDRVAAARFQMAADRYASAHRQGRLARGAGDRGARPHARRPDD
jgi:long-subunit acyl-CoA synthetase (AMP-forming)